MMFEGSSSANKLGAVWTISTLDHPATLLYSQDHKLMPQTATSVGLKKRQVKKA